MPWTEMETQVKHYSISCRPDIEIVPLSKDPYDSKKTDFNSIRKTDLIQNRCHLNCFKLIDTSLHIKFVNFEYLIYAL